MTPFAPQIWLTTLGLALTVTGCAAMTVHSYVPRGQDVTRYRTYHWASVAALSTGDPRLDNNSVLDRRMRAAIERGLAARRLEPAPHGDGDLEVHYHASVTQEVDVRGVHPEYKYCEQVGCGPYVREAGTLLVDLVDTRSQQLVWRGWGEGEFEGVIDDQRLLEARVDETVRRVLQRLPQAF